MTQDERLNEIFKMIIEKSKNQYIDLSHICYYCRTREEFNLMIKKLTKSGLMYFDDLDASESEKRFSNIKSRERFKLGFISEGGYSNEIDALNRSGRVHINKKIFAPSPNSDQTGPINTMDYAAPFESIFNAFLDINHGVLLRTKSNDFCVIDSQHDLEELH